MGRREQSADRAATIADVTPLVHGQGETALAAIVTPSRDAVYRQTVEMVVTGWNQAAVQLYGYPEDEAIGRRVEDLIVPDDRQGELPERYARIAAGARVEPFETVRRAKDG